MGGKAIDNLRNYGEEGEGTQKYQNASNFCDTVCTKRCKEAADDTVSVIDDGTRPSTIVQRSPGMIVNDYTSLPAPLLAKRFNKHKGKVVVQLLARLTPEAAVPSSNPLTYPPHSEP